MADQYQQYAYAAASGLPALFIYVSAAPGQAERSASDIDTLRVGGKAGPRIAVVAVPFPEASHAERLDVWEGSAIEALEPILRSLNDPLTPP